MMGIFVSCTSWHG